MIGGRTEFYQTSQSLTDLVDNQFQFHWDQAVLKVESHSLAILISKMLSTSNRLHMFNYSPYYQTREQV